MHRFAQNIIKCSKYMSIRQPIILFKGPQGLSYFIKISVRNYSLYTQ